MKKFTVSHLFHGIQNRFLLYTQTLLLVALLLSLAAAGTIVRKNTKTSMIETYTYMNEKLAMAVRSEYHAIDDIMKKCILQPEVQESLQNHILQVQEQMALKQYFSYMNYRYLDDYIYVDNKEQVYTKPYRNITYQTFLDSGFPDLLGETYSRTTLVWSLDTLFHTGESTLFAGRYIRSMEYQKPPGILFFRIRPDMLDGLIAANIKDTKGAFGITTADGIQCTVRQPDRYLLSDQDLGQISAVIRNSSLTEGEARIITQMGGILSIKQQPESGLIVYSFIPKQVLSSSSLGVTIVLSGIYLMVVCLAGIGSIYFAKRFTKPIKEISQTMTEFKGDDFTKWLSLHTDTELDLIGESYNQMLKTMSKLLDEIKQHEQNLRISELNSLIYQMNPHFLYNTLDTIYMLARINKEETTMTMIQALSKFLKISLSKGKDVITLEDELEHVKSYMEIQKIRNQNLFFYEILCETDSSQVMILKLILQPLVENSIKHGFSRIYESGIIRIHVYENADNLIITVYNNGEPITSDVKEMINHTAKMTLKEMSHLFEHQEGGYGVVNIISRLRLKYGSRVSFRFESEEDGTTCWISLSRSDVYGDII